MAPIGGVRAGYLSAGKDAIPDSATLNVKAEDYDSTNNEFVANIGPNIPDAGGNPSVLTDDLNGFDAVKYDGSDDYSQTTTSIATTDNIAVVATFAISNLDDNGICFNADGNTWFLNDDGGGDDWGIKQDTQLNVNYGHDTNYHTYSYGVINETQFFEEDGGRKGSVNNVTTVNDYDGFTIGAIGSGGFYKEMRLVETTVMDGSTSTDLTDEISRQRSEYGT